MTEPFASGGVPHSDSVAVAAFLDGQLRGRARAAFVAHLAVCATCREEVVQLRDAIGETRARPLARGRRSLGIVAAIAAVLLVVVTIPRVRTVQDAGAPPPELVRTHEPSAFDASVAMTVLSPLQDAVVTAGQPVEFAWRASGNDAMYEVTVQDSIGTEVWSRSGADTSVVLADSVRLVPGARYFWRVDARRIDGHTTRSSLHSFLVK